MELETPGVEDLSPSCKLVALVLQEEGALTTTELADRTFLPERTVNDALTRLQNADVVAARPHLEEDARAYIYTLNDDHETNDEEDDAEE